jgi:hypothetical protein
MENDDDNNNDFLTKLLFLVCFVCDGMAGDGNGRKGPSTADTATEDGLSSSLAVSAAAEVPALRLPVVTVRLFFVFRGETGPSSGPAQRLLRGGSMPAAAAAAEAARELLGFAPIVWCIILCLFRGAGRLVSFAMVAMVGKVPDSGRQVWLLFRQQRMTICQRQ